MKELKRSNMYYCESNIVDWLIDSLNSPDKLPVNISEPEMNNLIEMISNKQEWVDNSRNSDFPPDFYSNTYQLMMEIMNVSDNEHEDNGHIVNPVMRKMDEMKKELKDSWIFEQLPDNINFMINPITDLPGDEDHNYTFYVNCMNRVLSKHISKIPLYRKNHPDKKLIFVIFDESTEYMELSKIEDKPKNAGDIFSAHLHHWYVDKKLIESFMKKDIDYIIWFAPFKWVTTSDGVIPPMPRVCIYDGRAFCEKKEYDPELLTSSEE